MRIFRKSILIISIIISLSFLGYLISKNTPKIKVKPLETQSFNLRLFNVNWYEFDTEGNLAQTLYAPEIYQLTNSNEHIIISPELTGKKDGTLFKITSNQAKSKHNQETIVLKDNVFINLQKISDDSTSSIETTSLVFHPQSQIVHTKKPVTFKNGENIIHSIGMHANLSENQSLKLGHANGSLEPKNLSKTPA